MSYGVASVLVGVGAAACMVYGSMYMNWHKDDRKLVDYYLGMLTCIVGLALVCAALILWGSFLQYPVR